MAAIFLEGFTDISRNAVSLSIFLILLSLSLVLIIAMFSEKTRLALVHMRLLEKDEAPKSMLVWLVSVIVIVKLVQALLIQPFIVDGGSMKESLHSGDFLLVDKISYYLRDPVRGEVVIFKYVDPSSPYSGRYLIKRIIGLPGERVIVRDGVTTIMNENTGETILYDEKYLSYHDTLRHTDVTLGTEEYFVMGDNRPESYDSRTWGALDRGAIRGRALVRIFPLQQFSIFPGDHSDVRE